MSIYISVFVALLISLSCHSRLLKKSTASLDAQPLNAMAASATKEQDTAVDKEEVKTELPSIGLEFEGLTLLFGKMELAKVGATPRQNEIKQTGVPPPPNGVGFVVTSGNAQGGEQDLRLLSLTRDGSTLYANLQAFTGEFVTGPIPFKSDLDLSWTSSDGSSVVNTLAMISEIKTIKERQCSSGNSIEIAADGKVVSIQGVLNEMKTPSISGQSLNWIGAHHDTAWFGCGHDRFADMQIHVTFGTPIEGLIHRITDGKIPGVAPYHPYAHFAKKIEEIKMEERNTKNALKDDTNEQKGALDTLLLFVASQVHFAAVTQSIGTRASHTSWKGMFGVKPRIGRECVQLYNLCSPSGQAFYGEQIGLGISSPFARMAKNGLAPPVEWNKNSVTGEVYGSLLKVFGQVCSGSDVPTKDQLSALNIRTDHDLGYVDKKGYPNKYSRPYFLTETGEIGLARDPETKKPAILFEHRSNDNPKVGFADAVNANYDGITRNAAMKSTLDDATRAAIKVYACAAGMLSSCPLASTAPAGETTRQRMIRKRQERLQSTLQSMGDVVESPEAKAARLARAKRAKEVQQQVIASGRRGGRKHSKKSKH